MKRAWLLLVFACGCRREETGQRGPQVVETPSGMAPSVETAIDVSEGMASPEAAIHDPVDDVYLISNINGGPHELDDNGYILRMSPDGTVLAERWIDGRRPDVTLHAPRGMAIHGNTLYVVDADAVRLFDRSSGRALSSWPIPDPKFPNDLRVADDGSVYVTDTGIHLDGRGPTPAGTPTIWKFSPAGVPTPFAQGDELAGPNGIVLTPEGPIVAAFSGVEVYRWKDGAKQVIAKLPDSQLDGLVQLPDGALLVTSWTGRCIYRIEPDGSFEIAFRDTSLVGPASIAYDRSRGRLIIPLVLSNQVRIEPYPISGPEIAAGAKSDGHGVASR